MCRGSPQKRAPRRIEKDNEEEETKTKQIPSKLPAPCPEYRELEPPAAAPLRGPLVELAAAAGLEADCPFDPPGTRGGRGALRAEEAEAAGEAEFDAYASRLYQYLQACLSGFGASAGGGGGVGWGV